MSHAYHCWCLHSRGHLPDGSWIFVAQISGGYGTKKEFPAVLHCADEGLVHLLSGNRRELLQQGFKFPDDQPFSDAERSLFKLVPSYWGPQGGSICVIRDIPARLLRATTPDLARLLLSWFRVEQRANFDHLRNISPIERQVPDLPLRRPVAITSIPCTDILIRALHDGTLLSRLKLGLERIYVSAYAFVLSPRIEQSVRALALRFSDRLVIVPFNVEWRSVTAKALRLERPRAIEYVCIGNELSGAFQDDFDYDKWESPRALDGMFRFRIGDVPRGIKFLLTRELSIDYNSWKTHDIPAMQERERKAEDDFRAQEQKGLELLFGTKDGGQ